MLRPNTILGDRFKIVRMIGSGGMATVYEAQHTGIGRRVAVKVLNPSAVTNTEIISRFEREARAAGAIGHDNIVEVLDFGRYLKQPFIVMEYLAGESLGARLDRMRTLQVPMACRIMDQVLAALEAVHKTGIIHRDLKPENVFLTTKAGITDFVKLLDFGVSKFTPQGGDLERWDTRTGVVMGTPHYMAPEQAFGRRDVDHRVDIYAAGVLLYEMLTGMLPFDAENTADLLLSIAYHRPAPRHIREHSPEFPVELDAMVHKAIAMERELRFDDATMFRQALKVFLTEGGASRVGAVQTRRTIKRLDPRQETVEERSVEVYLEPAHRAPADPAEHGVRDQDFSTLRVSNGLSRDDPAKVSAPVAHHASELTDDDASPISLRPRSHCPPGGARSGAVELVLDPSSSARLSYEDMDSESPMPLVVRTSSPKDVRDDLELDLSASTPSVHPLPSLLPTPVPVPLPVPDLAPQGPAEAALSELAAPADDAPRSSPESDLRVAFPTPLRGPPRGRRWFTVGLISIGLAALASALTLAWRAWGNLAFDP